MQGKNRVLKLQFLVAIFSFFLMGISLTAPVFAASNMGQVEQSQRVTSKGTITFEEITTTTSSTIDSMSSSSSTVMSSSTQLPNTGDGKLPQTNELVTRSLVIAGVGLLIIGFFFILWKRRKKGENQP
ncbi:LPXTG cell wall anchor domain-containing protein [Enterococcus sp. HY326]|uniref:LPXTG cell wall anchor domain-containing protein n=1 Tax=Enterococcus sp. HY326 TaxID=2971265 RepID=UPI00223F1A02|nr:LPXTG cell wall anchor domain-containing protein [Enterococcus sp. HY326]